MHGADSPAGDERRVGGPLISNPVVADALRALKLGPDQLGRASISDLELGFSARNAPEWDRLAQSLSTYKLLETTATDIRRAKEVQRLLAAKHQRGRKVPDLLIAATAEAANLTILHYDSDFDLIASVTGQSCEWIVPAGSVD
jgi:predicted nucleic acid-binding protein